MHTFMVECVGNSTTENVKLYNKVSWDSWSYTTYSLSDLSLFGYTLKQWAKALEIGRGGWGRWWWSWPEELGEEMTLTHPYPCHNSPLSSQRRKRKISPVDRGVALAACLPKKHSISAHRETLHAQARTVSRARRTGPQSLQANSLTETILPPAKQVGLGRGNWGEGEYKPFTQAKETQRAPSWSAAHLAHTPQAVEESPNRKGRKD